MVVSENIPRIELSEVQLEIPTHLELYSGSYSHQGRAITAWERAGRRGILSMATGSGKTITALAAASRIQKEVDSLLIIVSAPYKPLVSQWVEEVNLFGANSLPIDGTAASRAHNLYLAVLGLQTGARKLVVMVVTENFLTSDEFRRVFDDLAPSITTLLIADEVHNLGKRSFLSNTPERFDYRLGLSATPERQYDPEGSIELFNYFGPAVFEFGLSEAIGICLVPYNYHIHKVSLSDDEYSKWIKLTKQLTKQNFSGDADVSDSCDLPEEVERLLFARRRVIESAESKIVALRKILGCRNRDQIEHVLIYTTDKNRIQLNSVNNMLQNDLNLTIHQLTSQETSNRARSAEILERFAMGDYHALTCMRVLDEGVNIPQVSEAFILASNTVRRQWIQRRGRILRKCDVIDKQIAELHDFFVIPPDPRDKQSRQILKGELNRAREFTELSANAGTPGGPLDEIENIMTAMFN